MASALGPRSFTCWAVVTCLTLIPAVRTQQSTSPLTPTPVDPSTSTSSTADCFSSSYVVGSVLGTFFATGIGLGLFFCLLWWICERRRRRTLSDDGTNKSARAVESGDGTGFDNPCFEGHPQSDVVDGSSSKTTNNGEDERKDIVKSTSWTPLRFFGTNRSEKKRSLDDSFISEPERVSVQLRGHDFTGLGFNVTGNMRDGIFIKDILNRGPAFESGKIAQGDRILSVTISFRHVVYEDALTILSYASPYDVTMELEKGQQRNNSITRLLSSKQQRIKAASSVSLGAASLSASSSSTAAVALSGSVSPDGAPSNERLVHPLYRSQSIDDLSKVGRADTSVRADIRIPQLGGSLFKSKLVGKAAPGVEVDLPDVKMKLPKASAVVDVGDINIAPPDVSLVEPKTSKFAKFGIKVLPDFKFNKSVKNAELTLTDLPTGLVAPEAELALPKVEIHTPAKSSNVAIDIDLIDGPSLSNTAGDTSIAIEMPEFQSPSVSMDVPDVNLDIDAPFGSLSSDSQSRPQFNVKAPQVEIDMPDVSISQTLPDTDLSTKEIKSGFHMKFPKFGGSSGTKTVKVDLPEAEISAPTVDVTLPDVPKIESSGGKAGFEFKMPKLSMKKQQKPTDVSLDLKVQPPTVDIPEVSVDVKGPSGASIDIEAPSTLVASAPSVELPSVSIEAKKPKMAFSMPKWNLGKGQVDVKEPSAELNLEAPSVQLDVTAPNVVLSDDDEQEGGKKKSKFSLKMPKKPKAPKGDIDINLALPKVSAEVSQDETTDADDEDGTSSPKKKTGKIKMKIPKPPKAEVNVDLSLPSVDVKDDSDIDGSGTKKKTSKFGLKMPKMSKGEIDVTLPKVEMKQHDDSDDEEDTAATKKKSKFGFKMPKMSKGEVDVNLPSASVELTGQSETDDDAENGASKKGKIGIKMPKIPKAEMDVNLDLPKVSAEVKTENETDDDASGKKKTSTSKFSLKMPKIPKGDVDVNISVPKVNAEMKPVHSTEEMSDDEATGVKKKSKFNIKMPKIPKGEVDVNLAAPKVSVETSAHKAAEDTSDDEANGATKKKSTKFSLKMPKWNVNKPQTELMALEGVEGKIQMGTEVDLSSEMRMSDIGSDEDDEGNKKRGKFNIKMPKFGMNKPQVQLEGPDVSAEVTAELPKVQLEAPSLSIAPELETGGKVEVSKKKSKFGFKMPKLGATATLPDLEVEGGVSKEVNVEVPNVDVKMNLESSSDDEDATTTSDDTGEKKKKRFHLKMPKFGGNTKAHLDAELPKMEVEAGAASVDLPELKLGAKPLEVEVALPNLSTDLSATVQSSDDESKKNKIDLKLPKLEMNMPDAKLDISATKSNDGDSSDDDENESKKKFGLKMPKFGISGKLDKEVPESSINVTNVATSIDTKESKKKGTKFGIKLPGLHFDKPHVEVSGDISDSDSDSSDDEKGANIGVKLPKIGLSKPTVEIDAPGQDLTLQGELKAPKLDVRGDIELPSVKLESELKTTKAELEIADVSDGEGGDKKKKSSSNKFSIKMPKFHMKSKKAHDLDVEVAAATDVGLDIDVAGGHTDDEHSDDEKKRGGKFSIKMPKFGIKKPHVDVELPSISKTISAEGEIDIPNVDVDIDVNDGDQPKKALFQVDVASVSIEKPEIDLNLPNVEIKQPKIDVAINEPSLQVEGVGATSSDISLNVDLPKIPSVEVEAGVPHLKKKSKFGIDIGKMGFNKPSVEVKAGSDMPTTDVGMSASIDVPKVDAEIDLSAIDDDKKKSSKFNFKMPKFHMGKPHGTVDAKVDLPSVEADITIPEPSAKLEIDLPSVDLSAKVDDGAESDDDKKDSKKKSRFGIKMPKFQMNKPHAPGVEIKAEQDLNMGADVTVELPELPSVEINTMDQELSTEVDVNLPKADVELNIPSVQLQEKEGKSKKGKFSFKMPKAPQLHGGGKVAVDVPAIKTQIDAPQVDIPEVEMKVEASKKSPFIVKMPELNMGKADIEVNLPKTKADLDSDDSSSSDDEKDDTKKKMKLGFKMPHFSMGGKTDATSSLEVEAPSVEVGATIPNPELSISTDVDVKKKSKFGFKMPSMSMPKAQIDVDAPSIESSDIRIEAPSVGLEIQHGHEGGAEATEENDDDETKKTGGQHKFGIKMPKFHLRQRGADVILPQVELKAEALDEIASPVVEEEIKVEVKKPKFGIKLPAMPELSKPKIDVEISKKEAIHMEVDPLDVEVEVKKPTIEDLPDVNVTTGTIDAEMAKVKAQLGQLQAEFDVQSGKKEDVDSSSSDSEEEKKTKSSGFSLKMPKFSLGKDKHGAGAEVKLDAQLPNVTVKHTVDETISPPSSLEVEPVKLESSGGEKEKKKFSIKMPKFQSKASAAVAVEGDTSLPDIEPKAFKINLKPTKIKDKKKKKDESSDRSDAEGDDEEETRGELSAAASSKLMDVEVKLPRVQVYKNVEYHDAEKEHHHESSSDEEDEVKDIKKNIGARFGVKLKKPKMFSSSKIEISGKNDPANTSAAAAALQPEWKLPRVDLRRTSKTMDQELTVDVDLDATNSKLEQLSPSERTDAIRRDAKSSAGIRLHSPSYISQMMPSPRSKKSSLELDVESSPRLLSVTRLDPTPPIESSASTQPVYSTAGVQLTASVTAPQVSVSDIPSSILMASEAVKIKRGPPTPARRSIMDPNSSVFKASIPVTEQDVPVMSCETSVVASIELKTEPVLKDGHEKQEQQASDTDISVTTSSGSDTLVISPPSTSTQQEGSNRKASSLGDLTRIPPSGGEDGSLERTVSLDFKPVASMPGGQSRAIYNLAVHDLSRVGEDSDEDYNLNRKRSNNYDQDDLAEDVEISSSDVAEAIITAEHQDEEEKPSLSLELPDLTSKTILTIDSDGDITMEPSENISAEALWFGSTSIQTVESVVQEGVNISYKAQLEESISTDVTLTSNSLGTSPSETSSSSSSSDGSEGSPLSPASPEPGNNDMNITPDLIIHQGENGGGNQPYHTEMTEITHEEITTTTTISRTITMELTSPDDPMPQPLTDLNPSAGSFAAVRNRFEQLSGTNVNGAETTPTNVGVTSPSTRPLSQSGSIVKRLSGNFEDPALMQKSFVQHMAPEVSEGALSRTVIISSLQLDRSEQNSSINTPTSIGPESPVPNLEPPC